MADASAHSAHAVRAETVKHYVETIFYIRFEEGRVRPGRLAEWIGVSAPTVTVTLQRLSRDGWVEIGKDRSVTLTERGETAAREIVRVHRLLERWLTDVLAFDWATADQEAQTLAAAMTPEVADRLDESMGHPTTCPHGNVIPGRAAPYGELVALTDLAPGVEAVVRRISEVAEHDAPDLLRLLHDAGLRLGEAVRVDGTPEVSGAIGLRVGGRSLALSTDVAGAIWVEPASTATS